jgi:2-oxoglutarate ferredoxin oxidoreductase subunit beta
MSEGAVVQRTPQDYRTDLNPIWCPGCGDYGVVNAIVKAYAKHNIDPYNLVMVSGIGCSSRLPAFVNSYGLHAVHGRTLPIATGMKVSRPELTVVAVGGDGDGYSIGGGHLPHACRKNVDVTYIVMNNSIYGLTKGQVSPTSWLNFVTKSTPEGSLDNPVNPIAMAIVYGATFVGRGFSSRPNELADLIYEAMDHKGFSWLDVISPCPTFNKEMTFDYYKEHVTDVPEGHDVTDRYAALGLASEPGIYYLGIIYRVQRPTFDEQMAARALAASQGGHTVEELFSRYRD